MSKLITLSGKRKTAIAKAIIKEGKGDISINKKRLETVQELDRLKIEEVLRLSDSVLKERNFDVEIKVKGGGEKSQIDAVRLALAKALIKFSNSQKLSKAFLEYDRNLLVADVRRKEVCKPGDSKARSKRQSSKR